MPTSELTCETCIHWSPEDWDVDPGDCGPCQNKHSWMFDLAMCNYDTCNKHETKEYTNAND
jgi:hypothetical protein